MSLSAEVILAKGTAGHELSVTPGSDMRRAVSRPEYAMYLRGLHGEPLWLVMTMYADDARYLPQLVSSIEVMLKRKFEQRRVDRKRVDYCQLARTLLHWHVVRGQCGQCSGTGVSQKKSMISCRQCSGTGSTALHNKDIAHAAKIPPSTYSDHRAVYSAIIGSVLMALDCWHDDAFEHIKRAQSG